MRFKFHINDNLFRDRVSLCGSDRSSINSLGYQADLDLSAVLLLLPPKCLDYRSAPAHLALTHFSYVFILRLLTDSYLHDPNWFSAKYNSCLLWSPFLHEYFKEFENSVLELGRPLCLQVQPRKILQ